MSINIKVNAEEQFNQLAESIFNDKKQDEFITISFGGENSFKNLSSGLCWMYLIIISHHARKILPKLF